MALRPLLLTVLLPLAACSRAPEVAPMPVPVESARTPPAGLVADGGAATDPTTGLPARVVHEASGVVMVLVPAGEFRMGQGKAAHRRVIRNPFYMGETEVTNAQFRRFVEAAGYRTDAERGVPLEGRTTGSFAHVPSGTREGQRDWSEVASWRRPFPYLGDPPPRDDHPVVHVTWNDAAAFAAHFGLRLPTEAEWEYAARAGTTTTYPWGDDPAGGAGYANLGDQAHKREFPAGNPPFPFDDGAATLAPVGAYKSNAWGLKDMIGNLEEWVQDTYAKYPADGADESAATGGAGRVIRGRSWLDGPGMNRPAVQQFARRDFIGFRVAVTAGP
jgi:sulfatase modifying factor 1